MTATRDYKSKASRSAPRNDSGGTLVGIFIGLLLGLAIAAAIAYWLNRGPSPFQPIPTTTKVDPSLKNSDATKSNDKPRFDFYKILPGGEETKASKGTEGKSTEIPASKSSKATERYFLQAGAFRSDADAEDQKAKLAFLGIESSIQTATTPDKQTWYRVRLGPYDNAEEMNKMKAELARRGVDATVIKN